MIVLNTEDNKRIACFEHQVKCLVENIGSGVTTVFFYDDNQQTVRVIDPLQQIVALLEKYFNHSATNSAPLIKE